MYLVMYVCVYGGGGGMRTCELSGIVCMYLVMKWFVSKSVLVLS